MLNQEPQHQDVVDSIHNQTGVLALNSHGEPVGDYYFQEEGFIVGGQEEDGYYAQQELQQQDEQAAADVAGQEEEQGMDMDTTITNDIIVPSSADAAVAAANADGFVVVFEDHINEYSQEVQEEEGQDGEVYQDQEDEESSAAAPSQQLYLQSAEYYDEVGGAVTVTENEGDELVQQNQDQQYPHETNHQVSGDYDGQEEDQEIVAADSSIAAALVASSSGYHHEGGDGGHIVSASYSEQLVYHAEQGGEEGQDDIGMNERAEENVGFEKLQEQPQHCDHDHNMMLVDADGVNNSAADDEASLLQDPQEYEQVQQQQQQHDIVSSAIHQQLPLEQLQQVEDGGEQEGAEADTGYEVILETTGGAAAAAVVVVEGSTGIDGGVSVGQEEDAYYAEEQIIDGGDAEGEFVEAQYQGQDQGYYEQEGYDYVEGEQEVDGAGYFDGSVDHEQPQQEVLVSSLSSLEPAAGLVTTIIDGDASTSAGGYLKRKEGEFVSDDSSVEISVQGKSKCLRVGPFFSMHINNSSFHRTKTDKSLKQDHYPATLN